MSGQGVARAHRKGQPKHLGASQDSGPTNSCQNISENMKLDFKGRNDIWTKTFYECIETIQFDEMFEHSPEDSSLGNRSQDSDTDSSGADIEFGSSSPHDFESVLLYFGERGKSETRMARLDTKITEYYKSQFQPISDFDVVYTYTLGKAEEYFREHKQDFEARADKISKQFYTDTMRQIFNEYGGNTYCFPHQKRIEFERDAELLDSKPKVVFIENFKEAKSQKWKHSLADTVAWTFRTCFGYFNDSIPSQKSSSSLSMRDQSNANKSQPEDYCSLAQLHRTKRKTSDKRTKRDKSDKRTKSSVRFSIPKRRSHPYTFAIIDVSLQRKGEAVGHSNVLLLTSNGDIFIVEPNGEHKTDESLKGYLEEMVVKRHKKYHIGRVRVKLFQHKGIQTLLGTETSTSKITVENGRTITKTSTLMQGLPICTAVAWWILFKLASLQVTPDCIDTFSSDLTEMVKKHKVPYKLQVLNFMTNFVDQYHKLVSQTQFPIKLVYPVGDPSVQDQKIETEITRVHDIDE